MVDVFAWLLLAGAAFASFNLVSRVVESQRREIGIGMALGRRPGQARDPARCSSPPRSRCSASLAGVGVGLRFNQVFRGALQDLLALPVWGTPLLPGVYARAAALGFAVPLLAAAYPVARAVRVRARRRDPRRLAQRRRRGLAPLLERLRLPGSSLGQDAAPKPRRARRGGR